MKSPIIRLFAVLAVGAFAVGGFAQQRGGMMRGGNDGVGLLMRKDVQEDLKLSADQISKIEAIQKKAQEDMRAKMEEIRNSGGDFEGARAEMQKAMAETTKKALAVLTPEQGKRFKEIRIQMQGNRILLDPEIQKELGVTSDQKMKIDKIQSDMQEGMRSMMQDMQGGGGMSREEMRAEMQKRQKKMDEDLGKVLTVEQAAKLKEMAGKPFIKKDN